MNKLLVLSLMLNGFLLFSFTSFQTETSQDIGESVITQDLDFGDCGTKCQALNPGSYEVGSECYDCMVANFKAHGSQFPKVNGEALRGFNMPAKELKEIHDAIEDFSAAEVYMMLGMMKDKSEPHTIIAVEEKGNITYFDFVNPCPDFCGNL